MLNRRISNTSSVTTTKCQSRSTAKATIETATRTTGVAINNSRPSAITACGRSTSNPVQTWPKVSGNDWSFCGVNLFGCKNSRNKPITMMAALRMTPTCRTHPMMVYVVATTCEECCPSDGCEGAWTCKVSPLLCSAEGGFSSIFSSLFPRGGRKRNVVAALAAARLILSDCNTHLMTPLDTLPLLLALPTVTSSCWKDLRSEERISSFKLYAAHACARGQSLPLVVDDTLEKYAGRVGNLLCPSSMELKRPSASI